MEYIPLQTTDYILPHERIPGLEAAVKAAREKFDKRPSEATHADLEKATTALSLMKSISIEPVTTYRDHE